MSNLSWACGSQNEHGPTGPARVPSSLMWRVLVVVVWVAGFFVCDMKQCFSWLRTSFWKATFLPNTDFPEFIFRVSSLLFSRKALVDCSHLGAFASPQSFAGKAPHLIFKEARLRVRPLEPRTRGMDVRHQSTCLKQKPRHTGALSMKSYKRPPSGLWGL